MLSNDQPGPGSGERPASSVGVFCGSTPGHDPALAATAAELGRRLAEGGHRLVYGGGRVGLMGTVADAALAAGGEVVGIIPNGLAEREVGHTGLTELVITESMHTRKQGICDRADGFIALPGGYGTLDEVLEILTWNQIGIIARPVVFIDVELASGRWYYEDLFRFLDGATDAGLVKAQHRAMAQRATTVAEAIAMATTPVAADEIPHKWVDPSVR